MAWKEKHERILENKEDIIKQYKDFVPVRVIAREYGVSGGCISDNLSIWGAREKHGIRNLLAKMLLEGD